MKSFGKSKQQGFMDLRSATMHGFSAICRRVVDEIV